MTVIAKVISLKYHEPVHNRADLPRAGTHVFAPELQVALILVVPIRIQVEERVHAAREAATVAAEVPVKIGMNLKVSTG